MNRIYEIYEWIRCLAFDIHNWQPTTLEEWKETCYNFACRNCGARAKRWPPDKNIEMRFIE